MTRNSQRLKLQYAGMTSSPDDYLSPDGELLACFGLDDMAGAKVSSMRHAPKQVMICTDVRSGVTDSYEVLYIHKMELATIAILKCTTSISGQEDSVGYAWLDVTESWPQKLTSSAVTYIGDLAGMDVRNIKNIASTLIVATSSSLNYLVWKDGSAAEQSFRGYKYLGTKLPSPNITFGLQSKLQRYFDGTAIPSNIENDDSSYESVTEKFFYLEENKARGISDSDVDSYGLKEEYKDYITENVMAKVNKFVSESVEKGWFVQPFLVRYALKMYDGSTTMASAPVYMPVCDPSSRGVSPFAIYDETGGDRENYDTWHIDGIRSALDYSITQESLNSLKLWKDIIKGVIISVSSPIYTYFPGNKIERVYTGFANKGFAEVKTISKDLGIVSSKYHIGSCSGYTSGTEMYPSISTTSVSNIGAPGLCFQLPYKSESEYREDLKNRSVFYVLKDIKTDDLQTDRTIIKQKKGYLSTLENQLTLKDSYNAHDELYADMLYTYNGRLNMSGVKRKLYNGFKPSVLWPYQNVTGTQQDLTLTIEVEEGGTTEIVKSAAETVPDRPYIMSYMYYPNTNVKKIWVTGKVYDNEYKTQTIEMQEHSGLNGSVFVGSIGSRVLDTSSTDTSPAVNNKLVNEPTKLYTSNALNPFVFDSENINTIGNCKILGMAVAAKAISVGQAGYYPMYAMTEDGVWILEVSATGGWKGKQAIMSDVCTVPEAIIETDGAVIMPTSRGLMLLQGEQAICMTDSNSKMSTINVSDLPKLSVALGVTKWNWPCQDANRDVIVDIEEYISSDKLRGVYDYKHDRVVYYRPDRDYSVVLTTGQQPQMSCQMWDLQSAPKYVNGCPVMIKQGGVQYMADLAGADYNVNVTNQLLQGQMTLSNKALIITRPIKGTELGMRDIRKQLDVVWHQGRYQKGSFDILLYGTEDYDKWHLIGQAKDATALYGHHGQHWMAFIIVLYIKNMQEKDHIDCIDVTLTGRLAGKSPAMIGYKI